jgi:hypothetical protein
MIVSYSGNYQNFAAEQMRDIPRLLLPLVALIVSVILFFTDTPPSDDLMISLNPAARISSVKLSGDPLLSLEGAESNTPSSQKTQGDQPKIIVWTSEAQTGGPEALVQLTCALFQKGYNVHRTSAQASAFRTYYPAFENIPLLDFALIGDHAQPGDIVVVPEVVSCDAIPRLPPGVRKVIWVLAGIHKPQPPCTFIHHSYYLARANHSPLSTVVMPYIAANRSGFAAGMYQMSDKKNSICIDNDIKHLATILMKGNLSSRFPAGDLEVNVIESMTPAQVVDLMRRCKVVIDGNLPGMERVPLEAVTFGAIPLFEPAFGIAEDFLDFPLPKDYVGPWDDVEHLEEVLYTALTHYEVEVGKFQPLRNRIQDMEKHFVKHIDTLFGGAAGFLVLCDGERNGALCLLAAISVLLVSPLSIVHIVMEDGDPSKYLTQQQIIIDTLDRGHMGGLVHLYGEGGLTIDELIASSPNNRTFLMAPDMVLMDSTTGKADDCWSTEVEDGWALCVPESMDTFMSEKSFIAGDCKMSYTSTQAFQSFQSIQQGKFPMERSRLASWALLCSRPIWLEAIESVSDWRRFCASLNKSSRKLQNYYFPL